MRASVALCALLLFLVQSKADAQASAWSSDEPVPQFYDQSRTLKGHTFMPFLNVPWPFVTTRVGSQTGIGYFQLKAIPVLNLGVITQQAKLVSFVQTFKADFRLARFLGLSTGFAIGNAVGVNSSGAYNLGLNYVAGGQLGLIFRLAQGEDWYLGLRFDGVFNYAGAVLPAALTSTARVDRDGRIVFNISSLTRTGSILQGTGSFMLAITPHRMVGFQGSMGFEAIRAEVSGSTGRIDHVNLAFGTTLRFDSLGVPLALLAGASMWAETDRSRRVFFSTINTEASVIGAVEGGVFYSNPKYVDVGLSVSYQMAQNDRRTQSAIVLNHFW